MRLTTAHCFARCTVVLLFSASLSAQTIAASSSRATSLPTRAAAPVERSSVERHSLNGPYVKAAGSFQPGLGYASGLVFGGGVDHRFSRFLLLSDVAVDTAKKFDIQSGFSVRAGAGMYLMKNEFGFGGGARCGKLKTSAYEKGSCRPFVAAVYDGVVRFEGGYYFPGTDKINHLQGVRTVTLFPFSKHTAFDLELGVYRFTDSFGKKPYVGMAVFPGIRYIF